MVSRIIAVSANVFSCCLYPTINKVYLILSYLTITVATTHSERYVKIAGKWIIDIRISMSEIRHSRWKISPPRCNINQRAIFHHNNNICTTPHIVWMSIAQCSAIFTPFIDLPFRTVLITKYTTQNHSFKCVPHVISLIKIDSGIPLLKYIIFCEVILLVEQFCLNRGW